MSPQDGTELRKYYWPHQSNDNIKYLLFIVIIMHEVLYITRNLITNGQCCTPAMQMVFNFDVHHN